MPNTKNDIFQLIYVYDLGTYADSLLQFAPALIGYCGTNDMTPEQVKNEFYKLACSFSYSGSGERTYAVISGLSENMDKAVALFTKKCLPTRCFPPTPTRLLSTVGKKAVPTASLIRARTSASSYRM